MTCQREKELLDQIEQAGQMYKVSALQLIKDGKRIAELEALNGALCRDSAGFVQERDALAAKNQALREAIELLYSWANNWDSEFMNDPEWKDRDFEIIKNAIMPDISADILRARDERQKKATYREFFDELARLLKKSQFSIKQDGRSVKAKLIRALRTTCDELEQKNG